MVICVKERVNSVELTKHVNVATVLIMVISC